MQNDNQAAIKEMLKSFAYLLEQALNKTTKTYDGIVLSSTSDNRKWNVRYNNEVHAVKIYGVGTPTANMMVKVIVPQGNQALAWFFVPGGGGGTGDGTTFIPSVSEEGIISWTNDGGLPNPEPVNIKGPQGDTGSQGPTGPQGSTGPYFTPSVDESGNLSWSNNGGLTNPTTVNIKGPQGEQGEQGIQGNAGPQGPQGLQGNPGYYFTPSVSNTGDLSWTNNGNLENPTTVNIKGPQGPQGIQGKVGPQGPKGDTGKDGLTVSVNGVKQVNGNITLTLSNFGITASVNELNKLDGVTATTTEINYLDGVSSNIQSQLNSKISENIISLTLLSGSNNWVTSNGKYYQDLIVQGVTENIIPYVFPNISVTNNNYNLIIDSWDLVEQVESITGAIRFWASTPIFTKVPLILHYI